MHPAFGEAEILEISADIRPSFPDNEPRIVEKDGRIYVNGFYRHGYLLAPYFAARAAELAMRARSERDDEADRQRRRARVEATTLAAALSALDYGEAKVATALNGEFVPGAAARRRR